MDTQELYSRGLAVRKQIFGAEAVEKRSGLPVIAGEVQGTPQALGGLEPWRVTLATGLSIEEVAAVEARAVAALFPDALHASSTKGWTGHTLGAAGGIGAIAAIHAMRESRIPPTLNLKNLDPEIDLDVVAGSPRPGNYTYAINNSFGFGGHNVALAVRKYRE